MNVSPHALNVLANVAGAGAGAVAGADTPPRPPPRPVPVPMDDLTAASDLDSEMASVNAPEAAAAADADSDSDAHYSCEYERAFHTGDKRGNRSNLKTLVAMGYGLIGLDQKLICDFENDPLFTKSPKKKEFKPALLDLIEEVERRKRQLSDSSRTNKQKKKSYYLEWLRENNVLLQPNHRWTVAKACWFREILVNDAAAAAGPDRFINFRGDGWILRMLHAWFDFDDARHAMTHQYDALSRPELDGRANPNATRVNAYEVIALNYWNQDWVCRTTPYPDLHPDFAESLTITRADVERFGPLDVKKIKNKLSNMKTKLNIIKTNWEASGNGEGNRPSGECDELIRGADELPEFGGADDRSNFLGSER